MPRIRQGNESESESRHEDDGIMIERSEREVRESELSIATMMDIDCIFCSFLSCFSLIFLSSLIFIILIDIYKGVSTVAGHLMSSSSSSSLFWASLSLSLIWASSSFASSSYHHPSSISSWISSFIVYHTQNAVFGAG